MTHSKNQPLTRKISKWFFISRQVLDEYGVFLTEKWIGNIPPPTRALFNEN
jgi:hypothetical protein